MSCGRTSRTISSRPATCCRPKVICVTASLLVGIRYARLCAPLGRRGFVESRQGAATRVTKRDSPLYTYSVSDVAELLQYATEANYEIDKTSVVVADAELALSSVPCGACDGCASKDFVTPIRIQYRCVGPRYTFFPSTAGPRSRSAANRERCTPSLRACMAFGSTRSSKRLRRRQFLPRRTRP